MPVYIDLTNEKERKGERVPRSQRYWIKELNLFMSDRWSIRAGEWLTDAVINCSQKLLKQSYPLMVVCRVQAWEIH